MKNFLLETKERYNQMNTGLQTVCLFTLNIIALVFITAIIGVL